MARKFCKIYKTLWKLASRWAQFCEILSHSEICRPVMFLEKKLETTHTMTTFSEQGARTARTQRKTESGNTGLLLTKA